MSADLKNVDPAIVDSKDKKPKSTHRAPVAQGIKQAPSFPPTATVVEKTTTPAAEEGGEATEGFTGVNFETHAVVKTQDDKFVSVPRDSKVPTLTLGEDKTVTEFAYSAQTLVVLNHWVEQYGVDGSSAAKIPATITHTDFLTLLATDWDKYFFNDVLLTNHQTETEAVIGAINASEKLGLAGLNNFAIAALSCLIRGKGDSEILQTFHQPEEAKDAVDEAAVNGSAPWLKAAVTPKN